jgi:large conductance mechanosensitive channel
VYGSTINALINFAIVAAVIYFVVVVPMTTLSARFKDADAATSAPSDEAVLLTEIRDLLAAEQGRPG